MHACMFPVVVHRCPLLTFRCDIDINFVQIVELLTAFFFAALREAIVNRVVRQRVLLLQSSA